MNTSLSKQTHLPELKNHSQACYVLIKYELEHGKGGINGAEKNLKDREKKEDYEGCIGIKRAIDEYKEMKTLMV